MTALILFGLTGYALAFLCLMLWKRDRAKLEAENEWLSEVGGALAKQYCDLRFSDSYPPLPTWTMPKPEIRH